MIPEDSRVKRLNYGEHNLLIKYIMPLLQKKNIINIRMSPIMYLHRYGCILANQDMYPKATQRQLNGLYEIQYDV